MVNIRSECYKIYEVLNDRVRTSANANGLSGKRRLSGQIADLLNILFPGYEAIVFLDTETTGLNPLSDHIIELSAVRADLTDGSIRFFDAYIRLPYGEHLPEMITDLTGITDRHLASYGYWQKDVLEEFWEILQGERILLAGHNLQFDLCFLRRALEQERKEDILSLVNAADYLDTLTVYKDRRPSPHKLSAAMQEYGYPVLGEHNALVDAGALLCLTCAMGDEREDLSSYINRFGIDPRYGLFGTSIEKVAYFLQDGMKPTELVKPHYKCR